MGRRRLLPTLLLAACGLASAPQVDAHAGTPPGCFEPPGTGEQGDPFVLWRFGPFEFEGEPLVESLPEGERVLVHGKDATGRRALVVLDGETGRMLSRTLLVAKQPLEVALSGELVAARSNPNRVDLFRLRGSRLLMVRSFTHDESISAPTFHEGLLFLREGNELACYDTTQRDALWRVGSPGAFHGAPAVRGDAVFAGWYEPDGSPHLVSLVRATGQFSQDVALGRHPQGAVTDRDALRLVAHEKLVFVNVPAGIPASNGRVFEWARVPFDGNRFGSPSLHALQAAPLETATGWIAPELVGDGATRWIKVESPLHLDGGRERVIELASPEHHAWLSQTTVPASLMDGRLYMGPCAADVSSLQVLWRREHYPEIRPVPVGRGLLVVEEGELRLIGVAEKLFEHERAKAAGLALLQEKALGERLAYLAAKALRGGEPEIAQRLADEADGLGANARKLDIVRAEARRVGLQPSSNRSLERRAALAAEERKAHEDLSDRLAEAAQQAADPAYRRAILAELFRRSPNHTEGRRVLERMLPAHAGLASLDALSWLEFLERTQGTQIELVTAEGNASPQVSERLMTERREWNENAIGYLSERLLVVTADAAPGAVARQLSAGELVCDVLAQTFGSERANAPRLELILYPTREEYLAHSNSDLGGLETVLGFTAGHFDMAAEVSRLFLPSDDVDGLRLLGVSAHELTHHWLSTRSSFGPPRSGPSTPGFWVVEAIATWTEELRLDVARDQWTTDPARAASLDTLRNAGPDDLLPWSLLLGTSFDEYCKLETRTTCSLSLDWQLGARAPRGPMQLFYAQGGGLAHYLFEAEGGRNRAHLLRAVEGYYLGNPLDLPTALGMTPEELGERVVKWARSTLQSKRPQRR